MNGQGGVWKNSDLVSKYLSNVRGGLPLAAEQIDAACRVIAALTGTVRRFADLGCGDGILSAALLDRFPGAAGVLVDHSPPMLNQANERFRDRPETLRFVEADLSNADWCKSLERTGPFDAIVSGFAIHHIGNRRKQRLYRQLFDLLSPGGAFINIEHVASPTPELEEIFNQALVDALHAHHRRIGSPKTREAIAAECVYRPDKAANILAPVETQCRWLRRVGFEHVDCYLKYFELAVFGGRKPAPTETR